MARRPDQLKTALADFVFDAVKHAIQTQQMPFAPQHQPLEDVVLEVVPISDLEMMVRAIGPHKTRYFAIKVSEDRIWT